MQRELATLQRRFFRLIVAPRGVEAGLAAIARSGDDPGASPLSRWLRGGSERLEIYANMYFYRLLDVLREDFARCEAAVGADAFFNLVTDYLLVHPPDDPSLRALGRRFPDFIAEHAIAAQASRLADLARFEWARVEVFDDEDSVTLTVEQLVAVDPAELAELHLQCVPALRIVADPEGGAPLVVWRRGFLVYHRPLEPREVTLLARLREGHSFAALCQALHDGGGVAEHDAVHRAARLVTRWSGEQMLAATTNPAL